MPNLSWKYAGDPVTGSVGLGNFWAASTFVDTTAAYFTAQTQTVASLGGRTDTNITTTLAPVGTDVGAGPTVPEPATLLLAAIGLPVAGAVGRRRSRA